MVYIPPEKISEIQNSIDILEVVSEYLPLKPSGKNYKTNCPFHEEKTPSFLVNPEKQLFHCFGCQEGGNVFHFLMTMDKVTFPEAVKILAERVGIELDIDSGNQYNLYKIQEKGAHFFQKCLESPRHKYGLEYLLQRKISPESIEKFQLGLAPAGWDNLLTYGQKKNFSLDQLEKAGLIVPRSKGDGFYDRFRSRVIFPIGDVQGRIVGFGGRSLGEETPKYLNSPESNLFNKSNLLYGFSLAREEILSSGQVGIVEGYTDVIMCHQYGFRWTVATLGTAFTSHHARLMKRFAREVYLIFDGDEAGNKASLRSLSVLLEEELDVKVVPLDSGHDPCDYLLQFGAEAFQQKVDGALDFLDYFFQKLHQENLSTLSGKSLALEEILPLVHRIRNPIIQDGLIQRIGEEFSLSPRALYKKMESQGKSTKGPASFSSAPKKAPPRTAEKIEASQEEENIFKSMLKIPKEIPQILSLFPPERFQHPLFRKVAAKLRDYWENNGEISSPLDAIEDLEEQKYLAGLMMEEGSNYEKQYDMKVVQDCIDLLEVKNLQKKLDEITVKRKKAQEEKNFEALSELTREYLDLRKEQEARKFTYPGKRLKS